VSGFQRKATWRLWQTLPRPWSIRRVLPEGFLTKRKVDRFKETLHARQAEAGGETGIVTRGSIEGDAVGGTSPTGPTPPAQLEESKPKRFHGSVSLDPTRVGRDASRIADEVIAHLVGLLGSEVTITLEIEAEIPGGTPDHVVRTVTENSRTLKFTSQGFEKE